jgi:hypothetical protein
MMTPPKLEETLENLAAVAAPLGGRTGFSVVDPIFAR